MSDLPLLRQLPRVDALTEAPALQATGASPARRREAAREAIERARTALLAGGDEEVIGLIETHALGLIARWQRPHLVPMLNATGVIIHTNLGRAPLPAEAVAAGLGYCNLEYDLDAGARGSRRSHVEDLICALSGAPSALVLNNNAAAMVLMLAALAHGREVIISRGELVEIGGAFRVPEIMEAAGVRLREVGTTNRTYVADYERAIGPDTAAILRVHPSNYAISGFTHRPAPAELARLARGRGLRFLWDLGTGTLGTLPDGLRGDDRVADAVAVGADAACFSGDKLFGGPQAGITIGATAALEAMARHPLARAMRVDKLSLSALQYCLRAIFLGHPEAIPTHRMLHCTTAELRSRALVIAAALSSEGAVEVAVEPCRDAVGGGSHPDTTLAGIAVTLATSGRDPSHLAEALRLGQPPTVATVSEDRLWLHLRTVPPDADAALTDAVRAALGHASAPPEANAG